MEPIHGLMAIPTKEILSMGPDPVKDACTIRMEMFMKVLFRKIRSMDWAKRNMRMGSIFRENLGMESKLKERCMLKMVLFCRK